MRLVLFGSGAFGLPSFSSLAAQHNILAVVSQPDRPAGRGSDLRPTPVSDWATRTLPHVPLLRPPTVNDTNTTAYLRALDADAWIVIAFGQKLSASLLADRFAINLHASLLPRWRGAAPINAAILAGDTQTGNSIITLAPRMDAGLILAQSTRTIDPHLTAGELHDLLAADGPALFHSLLDAHQHGTVAPRAQDEAQVTYAPKLSRDDAWVDFAATADHVRRRIHALSPWPGIAVSVDSTTIKILRAKSHNQPAKQVHNATAGTLIDADEGLIACAQGTALQLLEIQPAGKKQMTWHQFKLGKPALAQGATFASVIPHPSVRDAT